MNSWLRDPTICQEFQLGRKKDICYSNLGLGLKDTSYCDEIINEVSKKMCHNNVGRQKSVPGRRILTVIGVVALLFLVWMIIKSPISYWFKSMLIGLIYYIFVITLVFGWHNFGVLFTLLVGLVPFTILWFIVVFIIKYLKNLGMPHWLKGGLTGLLFFVMLFIPVFLQTMSFDSVIYMHSGNWLIFGLTSDWPVVLLSPIFGTSIFQRPIGLLPIAMFWFVLGSLIDWLYGKITKRDF